LPYGVIYKTVTINIVTINANIDLICYDTFFRECMYNKVWFPDRKERVKLWNNCDWKEAEEQLLDLQRNVAAAVTSSNDEAIRKSQHKILKSLDARMLAVRHASEASAGPGVDGVRLSNPADKFEMAMELGVDMKNYRASPTRLLVVTPKRGKQRNIKIPTMYDRALQALFAYTLAPVAEMKGDKKSFGFKRCRSAHDAHYHIMKIFGQKVDESYSDSEPPRYALLADVKACYESISHRWLLNNIPMNKNVLNQFLTAGHVFDGELFPSESHGISLGSSLSPYLANMTLDGLQSTIYRELYKHGELDYDGGNMIRFADDIVVSARSIKQAHEIKRIISRFLRVRGLALSPTKTKVVRVENGFDFLSRNYQRIDGMMFSRPSDAAVNEFELELSEYITAYRGSQQSLIEELNRKLIGWAGYHKYADAKDTFAYIDNVVDALLLKLCQTKHKTANIDYIIQRYFIKDIDGRRLYAVTDKQDIRIVRLAKMPTLDYRPINLSRNPYIEGDYNKELDKEREIAHATGKYRAVWVRQAGICFLCGSPILADQLKEIASMDANKPATGRNMAYVHIRCNHQRVDYYKTSQYIASNADITRLLENIAKKEIYLKKSFKFDALKEYLWMQSKHSVTLSFRQIVNIVGLLPPASSNLEWWHKHWPGSMRQAGYESGYLPMRVNLNRRTVTFQRSNSDASTVRIPEVFLKGKVPADAATELERFFEYVRKKYGI